MKHLRKAAHRSKNESFFTLSVWSSLSMLFQFAGVSLACIPMLGSVRKYFNGLDIFIFLLYFSAIILAVFFLRTLINFILSRFSNRLAFLLSWLLGSFCLIYLFASFYSVMSYGIVLEDPQVIRAIQVWNITPELDADIHQLLLIIVTILFALCIEAIFSHLAARNLMIRTYFTQAISSRNKARFLAGSGLLFFLVALFNRADVGFFPGDALPFFNRVFKTAGPSVPHYETHYPAAQLTPPHMEKKPDVVLVLAEAFRWSNISPELTPNLYRLRSQPGCLYSSHHYPGGHLTQYGVFPFLYGLDSYYLIPFSERQVRSSALEIFRANGYRLVAFDGSGMNLTMPPSVTPDQFDRYQRSISKKNRHEDDLAGIESLKEELNRSGRKQPLLSLNFIYSTHELYYFPQDQHPHQTCDFEEKAPSPMARSKINRYHNSVIFVDQLIGNLLSLTEEKRKKGELIFVFAGDHGEELFEYGRQGHAANQFEDTLTRTPLIMCFPDGKSQEVLISSGQDVMPTLFKWAIPEWRSGPHGSEMQNWFTGRSLLVDPPHFPLVISGAGFPHLGLKFGLIDRNRKYHARFSGEDPFSVSLERISDWNDENIEMSKHEIDLFQQSKTGYQRSFGRFFKVITNPRHPVKAVR